jgi:hypothetical protein
MRLVPVLLLVLLPALMLPACASRDVGAGSRSPPPNMLFPNAEFYDGGDTVPLPGSQSLRSD